MRIRGRRLYPSTLAERRVMMSLGGVPLYAPRGISPYLVARRSSRLASGYSIRTLHFCVTRFRSRQASVQVRRSSTGSGTDAETCGCAEARRRVSW